MAIDLETSVGDLVSEQFSRIRVFEKYGIDYCCGGKTTLVAACAAAKCDPQELIIALMKSDQDLATGAKSDTTDWRTASLTDLTNHLMETHHEFMKREVPRVSELMAKVLNAHGENHAELKEVSSVYRALSIELGDHLQKEEQVLFPMIQQMESSGEVSSGHCGTVSNPIGQMELEHDNAGDALRRLRELTNDYTPPADGCVTYQALLEGMEAMERDLHEHIHKENNILHPRVVQMEASLVAKGR